MSAYLAVPAVMRIDEASNLVIALPRPLFFRGIGDLLDEVRQQAGVPLLPQQNANCRLSIATGAAGFLVVLLHRLGQRQMDYGADIQRSWLRRRISFSILP